MISKNKKAAFLWNQERSRKS